MVYLKHPFEDSILDLEKFTEIKACTVNLTHLDFYTKAIEDGKERGKPAFIITFPTQEERDEYFKKLLKDLT